MDVIGTVAAQLVPVIALIALGAVLNGIRFFPDGFIDGLKRFVAGVTLPVLIFRAFARMELRGEYFVLAAAVFGVCVLMIFAGRALARLAGARSRYAPFLFQGFEAGMIGYALFSAVYGADRTGVFAVVDLGQVVFVFTVLMAQLVAVRERPDARSLAAGFLKSPVIIAIALGLAASAVMPALDTRSFWFETIFTRLFGSIEGLTTPLVCIVIGAGITLDRRVFAGAVKTVAARTAVLAAAGVLFAAYLVPALGLPRIYSAAILTLFVLPPPFVIAVFGAAPSPATVGRGDSGAAVPAVGASESAVTGCRPDEDEAFVSAVLSTGTLVSLAAFAVITVVLGPV